MKFHHLAKLFYDWGWQIKHDYYIAFSDYLKEMLKRDRVFVIHLDAEIVAVCFYYLTNDYEKLYKKPAWEVVNDEPEGRQIYIDKMLCKKWTPSMRHLVQEAIEERFPHVDEGYYHRAPRDRCVKILSRRILN